MELHEIERDIEALKSSPLVLVCRTPQGRVKAMSLQKCVETGSSFLYVAVIQYAYELSYYLRVCLRLEFNIVFFYEPFL